MAIYRPRNTTYILALATLIGLSRWLLPMSDTKGRIVIACGLALVAIDLTVIQYRMIRKMTGVPMASRVIAVGALTASTVLVSVLALPAALADTSWLSGCETPLFDESRFGNFGPDYLVETRHPMAIPPGDVEVTIYTYDTYEGRDVSYAPEQNAESLRLEFYLAGVLQGASAASPDLAEGVDFAEWTGSLGVVALADGADEVVIAHPTKYAGMTEANSVAVNGACLEITAYPPPTTTAPPTTAPPTTVPPTTAPPTSAPPTTVISTTVPPTTVPPTTVPPTTAPPTTVTPTTTEQPPTSTTTTTQPPITLTSTTIPATTVPTATTTPPATAPPTVPPTTAPPTTVTPTTGPPSSAPTTTEIRTFTPPPVDRIGTPPSRLAYTGSTVVHISTAAWLLILAGVSLQILFAVEPDRPSKRNQVA